MKKKFSLSNMELAKAALADSSNFNLSASIEEQEGSISIAYECASPVTRESTSVCWDDVYSIVRSAASEYEYQLKWLREDMNYTREAFYKHLQGHIPSINDAGQMEKALKVLGLGDSFSVQKPVVYVQY